MTPDPLYLELLHRIEALEAEVAALKAHRRHKKDSPTIPPDLSARKKAFTDSLAPFVSAYGREMCNAFWLYWTEPTQNGQRMRFELEKTWEIERRLITWASRNKE